MTAARPALFTKNLGFLTLGHFLQAIGYSSMLLLPLYLDHLGASRQRIGEIMAVASASGLLSRPAIGWSLDRFGRKPTLLVGTLLVGVGMMMFWWVREVGALVFIARIIVGVGTGTLFTGYFAFASDLIPEARRTEGIALFGISGLAPLMINPFSERLGIDPPNVRWFLPVLSVVVLLSMVPLLMTKETPRHVDAPAVGRSEMFQALMRRSLRSVWIATIAFAGMVATYMAFATVAASKRGMETPANLWLPYAVGAILVRASGGSVLDRIGPRILVLASMTSFAVAYVVTGISDGSTGFMFAALLAGFGHGIGFPALTSQLVTRIPSHQRGSGIAALTALWEVSSISVTPAFGAIADHFGDRALFFGGAAFAMIALCIWWPLERRIES